MPAPIKQPDCESSRAVLRLPFGWQGGGHFTIIARFNLKGRLKKAEYILMITVNTLQKMKAEGEKIAMLTAYESSFAALMDNAGVDVLRRSGSSA